MHVAHILRKYNPAQWGGTETAVKQLMDGLRQHDVTGKVFCPQLPEEPTQDPFKDAGHPVKRYKSFLPVAGLTREQEEQLVSIGGNLMSFDLPIHLLREPGLSLVHTHTLNRIGGIGKRIAQLRKLPFVVTIHGGVLDLPESVKKNLVKPLEGGFEWGKLLGAVVRSRYVLEDADAIVTCNHREARLLGEKYPKNRVLSHPHGVPTTLYHKDHREQAWAAFPNLKGRDVLLVVGRIDPVKNQGWLLDQAQAIFDRHPNAVVVYAGSVTDELFGKTLKKEVRRLNWDEKVFFTGGIPPGDPRLLGLLQSAKALIVPSISETFGLVILEGWAAGTPVISTRTSGATDIIKDGVNGRLFDLEKVDVFHRAIDEVFHASDKARGMAQAGHALAVQEYDTVVLAGKIRKLYDELIEEKKKR